MAALVIASRAPGRVLSSPPWQDRGGDIADPGDTWA
jgi:hypothetical protein